MKVDIYISTKDGDKYLSVPAGADVNQLDLPADLDPDLLSITPLKTSLQLDLSRAMVGINQEDVIKQIADKGYALHGANMEKIMNLHEKISYLEFPSRNLAKTQAFFSTVFGWAFADYGPNYTAFSDDVTKGGFFKSDLACSTANGSALVVFYSKDLEQTQAKIEQADGTIIKPAFSFPGGRRFHFADPNGNEYAVWSET